jgi:hypothetical protein
MGGDLQTLPGGAFTSGDNMAVQHTDFCVNANLLGKYF